MTPTFQTLSPTMRLVRLGHNSGLCLRPPMSALLPCGQTWRERSIGRPVTSGRKTQKPPAGAGGQIAL